MMSITISVSTQSELLTALASATAGTTILLEPGNYGDLSLSTRYGEPWAQFSGEVTIKSADVNDPAIFTSVGLNGVKNLSFDTVKFDYVWADGAPSYENTVNIVGSSNITIRNCVFDGDIVQGTGTYADGYGTGIGLQVSSSTNVTIDHNDFFNWLRAAMFNSDQYLNVTGNDVHDIRSDGFDFADVDHVLIEGNYIHDFHTSEASGDHADMIQFWTAGTTSPSTDIVISDNFLNSGAGSLTQSIFMGNEVAGMVYENVTIENNVIYNSHIHGITVATVNGLTINNNTILQNPDTAPSTDGLYVPTINFSDSSTDVVIHDNVLSDRWNPPLKTPDPGDDIVGNLFVDMSDDQDPYYVGDLFVNALAGSTATLSDLTALEGSIIDQADIGSSLTQPDSGNEPPLITSDGGTASATISMPENTTAVTTVTATDVDSDNLVYSISGGADASLFTIDETTGALAFKNAPDYEQPADLGADNTYEVAVQASDGELAATQALSVEVTDVNHEPVIGTGGDDLFVSTGDPEAFYGLEGTDTVSYATSSAGVYAYLGNVASDAESVGVGTLASTASLTESTVDDTYSSIEDLLGSHFNDRLIGNDTANVLEGAEGNDTLIGNDGADTLVGGLGADILDGGRGSDSFVYRSPEEGGDTILNFDFKNDTIQVSASGFGGGLVAGQAEVTLVSNAKPEASTTEGTFLYDTNDHQLLWDADGSGSGEAVQVAQFDSAVALKADDLKIFVEDSSATQSETNDLVSAQTLINQIDNG
jgi:Ca2+-binding RTX toxin-like protein